MTAAERKKREEKILESTLYLGKHTFTCKRSDGEWDMPHVLTCISLSGILQLMQKTFF